jgi:hypothetical protein
MKQYSNQSTTGEKPPILCIPRVSKQISETQIRNTFDELKIGKIFRIEIRQGLGKHNMVLIHYRYWFDNGNASIVRERLNNDMDVKVVYDDPWYWKVSKFRQNNTVNMTNQTPINSGLNNHHNTNTNTNNLEN